MRLVFVTGIGTGVGKTIVSAILVEALKADYWKPVQAGGEPETDSAWVSQAISNPQTRIHPEAYRFSMAASPHIAAQHQGIRVDLDHIVAQLRAIQSASKGPDSGGLNRPAPQSGAGRPLVIEGAGGLLAPLNERQLMIDLILALDPTVVLVSRNYLGSINHSLLTARVCKAQNLRVAGWIFNDQYLDYEQDIVRWTNLPALASVPHSDSLSRSFIQEQARRILPQLHRYLI
jgi:dethiobiotin synthetase